jgi:glyoxylase-like metal-dependent hydrolase (beta-lactamase superfamily II)
MECHILDSGYTSTIEGLIMRGGRLRRVECHSIVALLMHPEHGPILFDTGYAPRILRATRRFPNRLYCWITPLHVHAEGSVAFQLARWGLTAGDIRYVIISHFHADHIAGLRDFQRATFVATRSAYDDVARRRGLSALQRAFLPQLLPPDFAQRSRVLPAFTGESLPGLGPTHNLFGDDTVTLVDLPGHAHGQIGMLVDTGEGRTLFAADGCWMMRQVREQRPPHPLTAIISDDMHAVRATISNLHTFSLAYPDVRIVPCHCPETFSRVVSRT